MAFLTKRTTILLKWFLLSVLSFKGYCLNPYSSQELDDLEKEFVQQINQSSSVERSPLANQYIRELGNRLTQASHIPPAHFFIVKSNEINAFAGPGGHIGINSALILATETESELAAVMAHELAHMRLHHLYSLIEHQKQMRIPMLASLLASIALGVINPTLGSGAMMASLNGFAQHNISFTRSKEKEADRIGIGMLIRAGFDPRAMAGFFKKMQQHSRYYYTANIPAILRTHPMDDDRIAEADNRSLHLAKRSYFDPLEYHLFKEIIRTTTAIDNKQLIDYYQKSCQPKGACDYGTALVLIDINQFQAAKNRLNPMIEKDPGNLFFQISMAQAEIGNKEYDSANQRLQKLMMTNPDNYAVLMAYAQALLASANTEKAIDLLLKGFRHFKTDLALCETLAQAQADARQIAYAYFTESQCQLLQGRARDAMKRLQLVKKMAKNDNYLLARTTAMMEEIEYQTKN